MNYFVLELDPGCNFSFNGIVNNKPPRVLRPYRNPLFIRRRRQLRVLRSQLFWTLLSASMEGCSRTVFNHRGFLSCDIRDLLAALLYTAFCREPEFPLPGAHRRRQCRAATGPPAASRRFEDVGRGGRRGERAAASKTRQIAEATAGGESFPNAIY